MGMDKDGRYLTRATEQLAKKAGSGWWTGTNSMSASEEYTKTFGLCAPGPHEYSIFTLTLEGF